MPMTQNPVYDPTSYPSAGRAVQLLLGDGPTLGITTYESPLAHTLARQADTRSLCSHRHREYTYELFAFEPGLHSDVWAWAILTVPPLFLPNRVLSVTFYNTPERAAAGWRSIGGTFTGEWRSTGQTSP